MRDSLSGAQLVHAPPEEQATGRAKRAARARMTVSHARARHEFAEDYLKAASALQGCNLIYASRRARAALSENFLVKTLLRWIQIGTAFCSKTALVRRLAPTVHGLRARVLQNVRDGVTDVVHGFRGQVFNRQK